MSIFIFMITIYSAINKSFFPFQMAFRYSHTNFPVSQTVFSVVYSDIQDDMIHHPDVPPLNLENKLT